MKVMNNDTDMLEEYNFTDGIRGKYVSKYKKGTNLVILDPDLIEYFPDSTSVNEALRSLVTFMKRYRDKKAEIG